MADNSLKQGYLYLILTVCVLAGGAAFWASDLAKDPPTYYSGRGQSLATDPTQYVYHARNKILFDDWDPFDYPRWTVYQRSLTSGLGYLWMSLTGVSLVNSGAVGIILSLGGLVLILLGLWRHHRFWTLFVVSLLYVTNVTLLTYGRHPYLENGLIFLAAAVFAVFSRWGDRLGGVIAAGALAAVATLIGKLFGGLLFPAVIIAAALTQKESRGSRIVAVMGGFVVAAIALAAILYAGDLTAAFRYVGEQSYGLRGFPEGLSSPWGFLEHLVAYGYKIRLFYLGPDLLLFMALAGILLLTVRREAPLPPTIILALFWAGFGILALAPLNYSPLRYALFFIPAVIVLTVTTFDYLTRSENVHLRPPGKAGSVLLALLVWMILFQTVANSLYFNTADPPIRMLTWATLPVALLIAAGLHYLLAKRRVIISRRTVMIIMVTVVGLSLVTNTFRIRRLHFLDRHDTIAEAAQDLEQIIGPDAVVSGPYGPLLTFDSGLKSFIYLFGVAEVNTTLFQRYPITHLAIDVSNAVLAVKDYPPIGELSAIATYYIRDTEVRIYNVSKAFDNPRARVYRETHYERAIAHFYAGNVRDAGMELELHLQKHPMTKSAGLLLGDILWMQGRIDEAIGLLQDMTADYPTDFYVYAQCGRFLQTAGIVRRDADLIAMARKQYEKAAFVNRYRGQWVKDLHDSIARRLIDSGDGMRL